jgi:uncharacterized Zn-finger protein
MGENRQLMCTGLANQTGHPQTAVYLSQEISLDVEEKNKILS